MKRPAIESVLDASVSALTGKAPDVMDMRVPEVCQYALELERIIDRHKKQGEAVVQEIADMRGEVRRTIMGRA